MNKTLMGKFLFIVSASTSTILFATIIAFAVPAVSFAQTQPVLRVCPAGTTIGAPLVSLSVGATTNLQARYWAVRPAVTVVDCTTAGYTTVTASAGWSSAQTPIATVNNTTSKGLVTGVSVGFATIAGTYNGLIAYRDVNVTLNGSPVIGYDIIIVGGQSNAVGAGGMGTFADSYASPAIDAKIFQLGRYGTSSNQIVPATWNSGGVTYDALQHWNITTNRGYMGLAIPFARRYVTEQLQPNRAILIIPTACGGTSILKWLGEITTPTTTPNALYDDMLNRTRTALGLPGNNKIVAMLWHQGESDVSFSASGMYGLTPTVIDRNSRHFCKKSAPISHPTPHIRISAVSSFLHGRAHGLVPQYSHLSSSK